MSWLPDCDLSGLRVLIVDDDLDSCDLIAMALEVYAVETCITRSVKKAMEQLNQFQPDILLSDIAMPDEDGYALIQQVKQSKTTSHKELPVIAITAIAHEESHHPELAHAFDRWMYKPIDLDCLVGEIASLSGRCVEP